MKTIWHYDILSIIAKLKSLLFEQLQARTLFIKKSADALATEKCDSKF